MKNRVHLNGEGLGYIVHMFHEHFPVFHVQMLTLRKFILSSLYPHSTISMTTRLLLPW